MKRRELVAAMANRVPRELRSLRGEAMLSPRCRVMGLEEVKCPACRGTGWLDRKTLRRCPLCCGFREVPDALAGWFQEQMRVVTNGLSRAPAGVLNPPGSGGPHTRPGRTVLVAHRVKAGALQSLLQ